MNTYTLYKLVKELFDKNKDDIMSISNDILSKYNRTVKFNNFRNPIVEAINHEVNLLAMLTGIDISIIVINDNLHVSWEIYAYSNNGISLKKFIFNYHIGYQRLAIINTDTHVKLIEFRDD